MTENELKIWNRECAYAYFFENIPGLGKKTIKELWQIFGSYEDIYKGIKDSSELFRQEKVRLAALERKKTWDIDGKYTELRDSGIYCMPQKLAGFPAALAEIEDAPSALFVKGKLPNEKKPLVAVIGARNCSSYGTYIAKELGKRLAWENIGVISGMARGIDSIGQWAALINGGATFGVLGSGVDVCYPEENSDLYRRLCVGECGGGIISEFLPKTEAKSGFFPVRNRIISGMADAVVVVEAKEKSGTFITVTRALEQGKDVYAIPGRLTDPLSVGCLKLIEQGADLIWNFDLFIQKVKDNKVFQNSKNSPRQNMQKAAEAEVLKVPCPQGLTALQEKIYLLLDFHFQSAEEILCKLKDKIETTSEILVALSELECKKIVEQEGGFYRWKF